MSGGFLLDTNIVIGLLEKDASTLGRLDPATPLYLPCIVMGELFHGAYHSGRVTQNVQRLESLARTLPVLACDLETAQIYGELKAALRKKGRPIPENDIWIAAISAQKRLTLVTRDAHFRELASLSLQVW